MRGVIVMGPEDSGTGYTRDLLVASGAELLDPFDYRGEPDRSKPPLVKVSLPNGREWVGLERLLARIDINDPFVVLTSRRWDVLATAQVKTGHVATLEEALGNARRAYTFALGEIARFHVPFVLTSYEAFSDPSYRRYVALEALGEYAEGDDAADFGFKDANAKHLK